MQVVYSWLREIVVKRNRPGQLIDLLTQLEVVIRDEPKKKKKFFMNLDV